MAQSAVRQSGYETDLSPAAPVSPLTCLIETVEALSSARSVEDIAIIVRSAARALSGADGVTIVVRDEDRCRYLDEDSIEPLWKGMSFPMSACVSGWAMLNGETAVIPDIYADPRVPFDAYRPTFVKSMVMTPVRASDPVAAIGAYWSSVRHPTAEEISLLEAIARVTATAFENVWLYKSLTESNERRKALIDELDHRVKNTMASVQAIARQTLRSTPEPEPFVEIFTARLQALSRAHEMLARRVWKDVDLKDLAVQALVPLGVRDRVSLSGPEIVVTPETAVSLMLALHELAGNALRYGALSNATGQVILSWTVNRETAPGSFILRWVEMGGPKVVWPARRGVGSQWIERGLAHATGGRGVLDFNPDGVVFTLITQLSGRVSVA